MKVKKIKVDKPTYAQLERKNIELIAQLAIVSVSALASIKNASIDKRMGSGVLLQLTAIGGADIIDPVMIRDGLSNETIDAIKRDIQRSLDLTKSGV